jgi:hypothetical protein
LKKSVTTPVSNTMMSRLNGSADTFSVNGLLDNVSTGSFSNQSQNSPQSTAKRECQGWLVAMIHCVSSAVRLLVLLPKFNLIIVERGEVVCATQHSLNSSMRG